MKKKSVYLQKYMALAVLFLASSCSKVQNGLTSQTETAKFPIAKMALGPQANFNYGDTILNVTYENDALNSGIAGINATNATASDAAYIVSPGATTLNHAIAHKVVYGDLGYNSDGNWRSESDAQQIIPARYFPGDERRYEFSVMLKDWPVWNQGDPTNESNLFQLKVSGGENVPLMIRAQRNVIRIRYQDVSVTDILPNIQPYVNQWIQFRIDVLWATTATGYMKTYMKLPGQSDFVLVDSSKTNYATFTGNVNNGNLGYIKWGLYVVPPNSTRTVYHDDIRIINLNQAPTTTGLIWGNSIPDANPAYLDGPYTITSNITNPTAYNNTNHVYIHPNIKYQSPQNIVYVNSASPAPNPTDNVVGTPRSDFSRSTLSAAGLSGGAPGPGGRYLVGGWVNATSATTPSAFDPTEYYELNLEPKSGYYFNFSDIKFTVLRGAATHPNTFVLRSSIDNFATNISAPVTISGTTTPTSIAFNASALSNITTAVTFRLYAYGATATSGTTSVGVNDFQVSGQVLPTP
ncbi:heparin lyase I family protein [Pedobacter psychrodurus]|uniref:heparin lyase I family protein n=1 Tax=Pedobacter psychrodurus TaxID=2530456 RepID=UPI00292D9DAA|nr:heparin lyase I family protein [Pedobacter psychrodurus]